MNRILTWSLLFCCCALSSLAQQQLRISAYDDESIKEINIPDVLKSFENALNIISYSGSEPLDCKVIKTRMLTDGETPRVFFNDKVILESDLTFDAWSNVTKEDVNIREYLDNFNLLYPKTQDPSVTFSVIKVSHLKKTTYFYYNVLFESRFSNRDINNNSYIPVRRVAEIRLVYDTVWNAFINGVRFPDKNFNIDDVKNDFTLFSESITRSTDYKLQRLVQKKEQQRIQQQKINQLIIEADALFVSREYLKAFERYKQARAMDPFNEDVRIKIGKCENALEEERVRKVNQEVMQARIKRMKELTLKNFHDHDIAACKFYYDSLTIHYKLTNDPDLRKIDSKLQSISPFLSRVGLLESQRELDAALEYSTKTIRVYKKSAGPVDSLLLSEAHYWSGRVFFDIDSTKTDEVTQYLEEALAYSGNTHLPARRLLIRTKLYSKRDKLEAIEMATSMVNQDPDNSDVRTLRATVYAYLHDNANALKDYQSSIDLGTKDSMVYINKATMELSMHKTISCVLTSTGGLTEFPCNQTLYYLRILAQEESGLYSTAGKDFQKAILCGITGAQKDTIENHGKRYFELGLNYFDKNQPDSAFYNFSRSYELCQNLDGLFYRGYSNLRRGKVDQALVDLNRVIQIDSLHLHAYYMRGIVKAAGGNHESAIVDYKKQIELLPNYWKSYAACGRSEIALGLYEKASESFQLANERKYTDSIASKAVYACVLAGEYFKAIALADKYEEDHNSRSGELYKCRGIAEYKAGKFQDAEDDLIGALGQDEEDVEAHHYLAFTYLMTGELSKAQKSAERARFLCNDCGEGLVVSGIAQIAEQHKQGNDQAIEQITTGIKRDTTLNTGANLAWIAYGYLLSQRDINKFSAVIQQAKSLSPNDPMVLFVQSAVLAESESDRPLSLKMLDQACANGFRNHYLILGDPSLQTCKNMPDYKSILKKYFFD